MAAATIFALLGFLSAGLSESETIRVAMEQFIMVYLVLVVVRSVFFFFGSFRQRMESNRMNQEDLLPEDCPLVSVLLPCYNEEAGVRKSLEALGRSNYPNLEIVVVNDGSSDQTIQSVVSAFDEISHATVKLVHQENVGKAHALNNGFLHASGDLILCIDGDSEINPTGIEAAVRHFENPQVGAIAGFVEVANQNSILCLLQELEYLVGLNFTRRALSHMGMVPIVPGPAGMFRRQALVAGGGFTIHTKVFAEDAELSLRLLSKGWQIKSEEGLIAVTEAPEGIKPLLRQRNRWNRGTYQALIANLYPLLALGSRGWALASYLFIETVITPVINFGLMIYFLSYFFTTGSLNMFTWWFFYLLAIDLLTTVFVTFRQGHLYMWLPMTLLNKVFYFYMLLTWRLFSLFEEWAGVGMSWDKLERSGENTGGR